MNQVLASLGNAGLCVLAAMLAAAAVAGLRGLARRYGGRSALTLAHFAWVSVLGVLASQGLLLLWPALAPWHALLLGGGIGLAWAAMQPGLPAPQHRGTHID